MSDILVVPKGYSESGAPLLAKNCHGGPNESQGLVFLPAMSPGPGAKLACTHIQIPQVESTFAVMLSRPAFAWGGEMGVNDHGVCIANLPVFTKEQSLKPGLLGVDLVRLALERCDSARGALELITKLIAEHGQGGRASHRGRLFHHDNSFILVDKGEVWKLETAGAHFAAGPILTPEALSNLLTLKGDYTLSSPGLEDHARRRGFTKRGRPFNFAEAFGNRSLTRLCDAKARRALSQERLDGRQDAITPLDLMAALRGHTECAVEPIWSALNGGMASVCMHGGGLVEARQTTASMIWDGSGRGWYTGTSAPCLSLFKPIAFDPKLKEWAGPLPGVKPDTGSIFWRHEHLHRGIACAGWQRPLRMKEEVNFLEARMLKEEPPEGANLEARREYLIAQWGQGRRSLEGWIEGARGFEAQAGHLTTYWTKRSREIAFPMKGS